jgi:uncharacterized protein (TIGR03437 family)
MHLSQFRLIPIVAFILSAAVLGGTWLQQTWRVSARQQFLSQNSAPSRPVARMREQYGKLPLRFERNQGQSDSQVNFLARGSQYGVFLTNEGLVLQLTGSSASLKASAAFPPDARQWDAREVLPAVTTSTAVRLHTVAANPAPQITMLEELPTHSHYFFGNDSQAWQKDVKNYARVRYEAVWPGIDLEWYGNQQQLEYDFVIAPGADVKQIRLSFTGAQKLRIDDSGALVIMTELGPLEMLRPMAWQEIDGKRHEVKCVWQINRQQQVELRPGRYDRRHRLVIDPILAYSRVLGGSANDVGLDIAVDGEGNAYVTGLTASPAFPGTSSVQNAPGGNNDVFVLKLNPEGSNVLYATWLGGSGSDIGTSIATDASGQVWVAGFTDSTNFPLQSPLQGTLKGESDAFIARLNATGSSLTYSTYLGGEGIDRILGMAVDAAGNMYFTGGTSSLDFPLMAPLQSAKAGSTIYASSNAASQWNASGNSGNGLNATRVHDLAIHPSTTTTLYAATDRGVWKSVNSAAQWTRAGEATLSGIIQGIYIDPGSASRVYAITSTGTLFRSNNGGDTWQVLSLTTVSQLTISAANPANVYAVAAQGLSRSTDNGDTWTQILSPNQYGEISTAVSDPATPTTLYVGANRGTASAVYKSTDGGTTWQPATIGLISGAASRYNRLVISPGNPATLLIHVTPDVSFPFEQVYKTTNGGSSWQSLQQSFPSPIRDIEIDPTSPTAFYVATNGSGIYKSTDGGSTWVTVNNGLANSEVLSIVINPTNAANVYAGTDSSLEAFITKLNPAGSALIYSTYLGSTERDYANAIAIDAQGNTYVTGVTYSPGFPTANAWQATKSNLGDGFVTRMNATGSALAWSTFLGGAGFDEAIGLAINGAGNVYVTGQTTSANFPTVNPWQGALDAGQRQDAFVTRFNAGGNGLDFSTYLGGSSLEIGTSIALDAAGNVYVAGITGSRDFPIVRPVQEFWNNTNQVSSSDVPNTDAFVTKFNPGGQSLLYSTWLGGRLNDQVRSLVADATGNVWVTGLTASENFPATIPYQSQNSQRGLTDLFLTKLGVSADLAVTLADEFDPVMVNNDLTYRATITNNGPDTAIGVNVTITLPAGVSLISATPGQGTCNGLTCTLGDLTENTQVALQFVVRGNAAGNITTSVRVSSTAPDAVMTNNTATQETKISSLPSIVGRVTAPAIPPATLPQGLSNVTMTLSGGSAPTQSTRPDGGYQFAELALNGSYTVTPARQGYVFTPENRALNNLTQDQRADFTATLCKFTLSAAGQTVSAPGGTGSVTITAPDARCPWTVQSSASWLTVTSATSGNGNATISFAVTPTTRTRVAALRIAGKVFTVTQTFNPCPSPEFITPQFIATNSTVMTLISAPPVKAADFNGDGRADLAYIAIAPSSGSFALSLILSRSAGGYEPPALLLGNPMPTHFSIGDFNKDGRPDLAVSVAGQPNTTTGTVQILLNNGNGTFAAPVLLTTRPGNGWITVTDVNADGNADLAVTGAVPQSLPVPPPTARSVSILLGNGTGGFGTATFVDVPIATPIEILSQIEAGDFDADGKTHLVTLGSAGGITVLRGNGTGAFTVGTQLNQSGGGDSAGTIAVGDFNGDGRTDLVHLGIAVASTVQMLVRLSDGTGGFSAPVIKTFPDANRVLSAADLNRDNRTDLILMTANGIGVLLASERGEFGEPTLYSAGSIPGFQSSNNRGAAMAVTDFNADGQSDVIVPVILGGDETSPTPGGKLGFAVLTGQGNGNFQAPLIRSLAPVSTNTQFVGITGVTDLDGDGLTDFIARYTRNGGFLTFNYSDGRGGFVTVSTAPDPSLNFATTSLLFLDFNRDGLPDYVTINSTDGKVQVFLNNAARSFTPQASASYGQGLRLLTPGDFNSDGIVDLLVATSTPAIRLLIADGQGKFNERPTSILAAFAGSRFNAADFNGDRQVDLLITPAPNAVTPDQSMRILTGDGQGNFSIPQEYGPASSVSVVLTPDLNRDGRSDLIFFSSSFPNGRTSIAFARDDGSFERDTFFNALVFTYFIEAGIDSRLLSFGDLDNDGIADLIMARNQMNSVVWLRGKADGTFEAARPLSFASAGGTVIAGQFNEDSATDLLLISQVNLVSTVLSRGSCPPANWATTVPAANYSGVRPAQQSIVAAFGTGLSAATQSASAIPLPTMLSGVSVRVTDSAGTERPAPLFFVSPGQINYQIPPGAVPGTAIVRIVRDGNIVSTGTIEITSVSPGIFSADASGTGAAAAYVVRVRADASQVTEQIVRFNSQQNRFEMIPIDLSNAAEQVVLVLFGSGLRGRSSSSNVTVRISGENAQVLFADAQGDLVGLDQINVLLPRSLSGRGEVHVEVLVEGKAANPVRINVR